MVNQPCVARLADFACRAVFLPPAEHTSSICSTMKNIVRSPNPAHILRSKDAKPRCLGTPNLPRWPHLLPRLG